VCSPLSYAFLVITYIIYIYINTHTQTHAQTRTHTHTHAHTHTHTHIHTHTHTHTNTQLHYRFSAAERMAPSSGGRQSRVRAVQGEGPWAARVAERGCVCVYALMYVHMICIIQTHRYTYVHMLHMYVHSFSLPPSPYLSLLPSVCLHLSTSISPSSKFPPSNTCGAPHSPQNLNKHRKGVRK